LQALAAMSANACQNHHLRVNRRAYAGCHAPAWQLLACRRDLDTISNIAARHVAGLGRVVCTNNHRLGFSGGPWEPSERSSGRQHRGAVVGRPPQCGPARHVSKCKGRQSNSRQVLEVKGVQKGNIMRPHARVRPVQRAGPELRSAARRGHGLHHAAWQDCCPFPHRGPLEKMAGGRWMVAEASAARNRAARCEGALFGPWAPHSGHLTCRICRP
jgi:hypothetical protein